MDGTTSPNSAAGPKVFVRAITTPAGAPWDQARAADLEARAGAPLPLIEIVYQLRRLEPWRPGQGGRYAAFYARRGEVGERTRASAMVEGRAVEVEFVSVVERQRQARRFGLIVGGAAAAVALFGGAVGLAFAIRADHASDLEALETLAAGKARLASLVETRRREDQALTNGGLRGREVRDLLGDLAWASAAKNPDAHIDAVHWEGGFMAVEVRGEAAPFSSAERQMTRFPKPLRADVWLWGVTKVPRPPSPAAVGDGRR